MFDLHNIPQDVKEDLDAYAEYGRPTGDFLRAVLENDLKEAFGRASETSALYLGNIVAYVYYNLPYASQGSPEKVAIWIKMHEERRAREKAAGVKQKESAAPAEPVKDKMSEFVEGQP